MDLGWGVIMKSVAWKRCFFTKAMERKFHWSQWRISMKWIQPTHQDVMWCMPRESGISTPCISILNDSILIWLSKVFTKSATPWKEFWMNFLEKGNLWPLTFWHRIETILYSIISFLCLKYTNLSLLKMKILLINRNNVSSTDW